MTQEIILKIGKTYVDRKGQEYEVIAYNNYTSNETCFVLAVDKFTGDILEFSLDGRYYDKEEGQSDLDLIREVKPKKKLTGFLMVWQNEDISYYKKLPASLPENIKALIDLSKCTIEYTAGDGL